MVGELTILIAKIMSLLFLCIGLGAFFNKNFYQNMIKDTFNNTGTTVVFGYLAWVVQ